MTWLTRLRQATATRRGTVQACAACGTRDDTIEQQRAALDRLRAELAEVRADAVSNLHALFTLPLLEEVAARGDQLGVDERTPQWVREYALSFMAECAGYEPGTRVLVADAHHSPRPGQRGLPGTVREVWLDNDGEPTLFIAMDNLRDALRLIGFDEPDADPPGNVADYPLLVPMSFPLTVRSIEAGGWIEAIS